MAEFKTEPAEQDFTAVISGAVHGNVNDGGSLLLRNGALVYGDVRGNKVTVEGIVCGDVMADNELHVGPTGLVTGRMSAPSLDVCSVGLHRQAYMSKAEAVEPSLIRESKERVSLLQVQGEALDVQQSAVGVALEQEQACAEGLGQSGCHPDCSGDAVAEETVGVPVSGSTPDATLRIVTY